MSVLINLPPLSAAISISKETKEDDPKGYVCVRNNYAIITSNLTVLVFNLRDYFMNYEDIEDEDAFEELLVWMNGKNFSKSFWKDMEGLKNIKVIDSAKIKIELNNYEQDLIYIHQNVLLDGVLKLINYNQKTPAVSYPTLSYATSSFEFIKKAVGKIVVASSIIIENVERERPARFTYHGKPFIFGMIQHSILPEDAAFNFEDLEEFCSSNPVE